MESNAGIRMVSRQPIDAPTERVSARTIRPTIRLPEYAIHCVLRLIRQRCPALRVLECANRVRVPVDTRMTRRATVAIQSAKMEERIESSPSLRDISAFAPRDTQARRVPTRCVTHVVHTIRCIVRVVVHFHTHR